MFGKTWLMEAEDFNTTRERLFRQLLEDGFERKPEGVTLSSGIKSDFYVDCRGVALSARGQPDLGMLLCNAILERVPNIVAIGGPTSGADPLTSAVAHVSGQIFDHPMQGFFVRKQEKGHGTSKGRMLEGAKYIPQGAKVAFLEDVVTTGDSCIQAISNACVERGDLDVRIVAAIVDREEGLPGQPIGRENLLNVVPEFVSLYTASEFKSGQLKPWCKFER